MISLSIPAEVKTRDIVLSAVFLPAALLFAPDSMFEQTNVGWPLGLFIFPFMFFAGLISAWLYYRDHDRTCADPFYIRAWVGLPGGLIALPSCLLFRPSVAHLAFIGITFCAGPVLAFQVYRRITKHKRT